MEAWIDKWKMYLRKLQRPMRVITERQPVPGYEELCFDESVKTFHSNLLRSPSGEAKGNCQNVLFKSERLYHGLVVFLFDQTQKLFTKTHILKKFLDPTHIPRNHLAYHER
jgi:hypothetical protein